MQRHAHLRDDLNFVRIAARLDSSGANAACDFPNRGGGCHIDEHAIGDLPDEPRHLRTQARKVDRKRWLAGLPGKLEALPRRIDFSLIFHSLTGGSAANDVDVLAGAAQRTIECASVPGGDSLVRDAKTQEQPSSRKVLQRGRLDAQSDCAAAIDMIDSGSQLERASARR